MKLTKNTKLRDIDKKYPWLKKELMKKNKQFAILDSSAGKQLIQWADISMASQVTGMKTETIISELTKIIKKHEGKKE